MMITKLIQNTKIKGKIMASIFRKIINLLIILRVFYWHTLIATIYWLVGKAKESQAQWAKMTFNYFQVKLSQCEGSKPIKEGKIMIFANHRSQADFFLHNVMTNFKTSFLSRMAVLLASPIFITSYKTVWFFNRGKKTDPEKFNQWLDKKYSESPRPGLLVYPEGHRMHGSKSIDAKSLKTGMLKYAYRRKISSQILISFGNERVFNQKRLQLGWNQTVMYKISQVIEPADYPTEEEYLNKVRSRFCELFNEVHDKYIQIFKTH